MLPHWLATTCSVQARKQVVKQGMRRDKALLWSHSESSHMHEKTSELTHNDYIKSSSESSYPCLPEPPVYGLHQSECHLNDARGSSWKKTVSKSQRRMSCSRDESHFKSHKRSQEDDKKIGSCMKFQQGIQGNGSFSNPRSVHAIMVGTKDGPVLKK